MLDAADYFICAWVAALGWHYFASMRRLEKSYKERPTRREPSGCDEVLVSLLLKLEETERFAGRNPDLKITTTRQMRFHDERFVVTLTRAEAVEL